MRIIALNGSPERNGDVAYILNRILSYIEEQSISTEVINISEAMLSLTQPFCINCSSPCTKGCYAGSVLDEIYQKVTQADAIIVGSPVYFGSMSAQLKAFFDKTKAVRGQWIGKLAAVVSCGGSKYGGQELTLRAMEDILFTHGFRLVGDGCSGFDAGHSGVAAQSPAKEDVYAMKRCDILAHRIVSELTNRKEGGTT